MSSIYGVSSQNSSVSGTQSLAALLDLSSTATSTYAVSDSTATHSVSTNISGPGQLLGKLQQLEQTAPDKFKQIVTAFADKLKALDKAQGDTDGSSKLAQLADKFEKAGETGDLSSLQPPPSDTAQSSALSAYGQSNSDSQKLANFLSSLSSSSSDSSSTDDSSTSDSSTSSTTASATGSTKTDAHKQLDALFQQFSQEIAAALQ